jgi:hypothetical protein
MYDLYLYLCENARNSVHGEEGGGVGLENTPKRINKKSAKF